MSDSSSPSPRRYILRVHPATSAPDGVRFTVQDVESQQVRHFESATSLVEFLLANAIPPQPQKGLK